MAGNRGFYGFSSYSTTNRKTIPILTGLYLWLKADSIFPATSFKDGDAITNWGNSVFGAGNAYQTSASAKPLYKTSKLNGLPGVYFDGSDDYMDIGMANWPTVVATFYGVATFLNSKNPWTLLGWSNRADEYWRYSDTKTYCGLFRNARLENVDVLLKFPVNDPHIITIQSGVSNYNIWCDRNYIYRGSSNWGIPTAAKLCSAITLGTNTYTNCYLHEMLVYDTEHTAIEMGKVWDYLRSRWGV